MNRYPIDDEFDDYDPFDELDGRYAPSNTGKVEDEAEDVDYTPYEEDEDYAPYEDYTPYEEGSEEEDEDPIPCEEDEDHAPYGENEPQDRAPAEENKHEDAKGKRIVSTFDKYFGSDFMDDPSPAPIEKADTENEQQSIQAPVPPPSPEQKNSTREERWQHRREWNNLRFSALAIGAVVVFYIAVIAFLVFFPRSTVSNIENRTLAEFPTFTMASYLSGDYTSDIATWYDDTVPYRDSLKNLGYSFTSLFGFTSSTNTITFINQDVVANDMNAATADEAAEETAAPEVTEEPDQTDYTAEEAEFDLTNGLLVVYQNGHWKCLGLFGGGSGSSYISALNTLQEELGDSVTIYSMPCPLASQFYVPSNASGYSADQDACFESIAEQLDSNIVSINICSVLAKHTDEDIYLRTDHHWAPLGAYYAARTFAEAAGVDFADITEYIW